jgi:hypothetical protein
MAKKKRKDKKQASIKGKVLEAVVASLHDAPDVKVERNVRLPTLRDPERKREIDVLVNGLFAGYPVRIAIECKNRKSVLDVPYIDAYIGKLQDVGIPTQHGIIVSPLGFTAGAVARAKEVGIATLILTGLNPERLSAKITQAIQSVVYLLLEIKSLSITTKIPRADNTFQLWFLYDREAQIQGAIPDLIWEKWVEGTLPLEIGDHEFELVIPEDWQLYVDGRFEPVISAKAKIEIVGVLVTIEGEATQHALLDAANRQVNRFKTKVSFDTTQKTYPVTTVTDEEDLRDYLEQLPEKIKLSMGRFPLPRIKFYSLYWPLSARATTELASLTARCQAEKRKASDEELAKIEGSDLRTIWDPIWSENPVVQRVLSLHSTDTP